MSLGLAACGSDSDSAETADDTSSESAETTPSESPSEPAESESESTDAEPMNFGAGCEGVPTSGPGSVDGMADDPVGTAASNNPLLTTLTAAVQEAGLVQTLNGLEAATVFAPTDDAFAKIPQADLDALLADKEALTQVLLHHVVPERLDPSDLAGDQDTAAEDVVTVEGEGEEFEIPAANGGELATVVCGNVQTANANVYVIDSVLMPEMTGGGNGR